MNVLENIEKYQPNEYPNRPSQACTSCGTVNSKDANFCSNCGVECDYQKRLQEYCTERTRWEEDVRDKLAQFQKDAMEELGLTHLPNANQEAIYQIAWKNGHANGLHEVLLFLEELAPLFDNLCAAK